MIEMSMNSIVRVLVGGVLISCFVLSTAGAGEGQSRNAAAPKSRVFRFHYGATLHQLPAGARVRVWLPVPQTDEYQSVRVLPSNLPAESQISIEPKYGNKILYFETTTASSGGASSGEPSRDLKFSTAYLVNRREVRGLASDGESGKFADLPFSEQHLDTQRRKLFLSASRKTPLVGKHLDLLQGVRLSPDPLEVARVLYDRVDAHVRYDKSRPGYGQGDVLWVCDSRFGNCTDFHSLFISWARSKGLPARFEIGFPLPPKRGVGKVGGYHCWAWFHRENKGWAPVDISEADKHPQLKEYYFGNLTENRVAFTTGRDIELTPRQDGGPLNFFIYPYVEVDGRAWPRAKIALTFSYADERQKK